MGLETCGHPSRLSTYAMCAIFLVPALTLTVPKGIGISETILLIGIVFCLPSLWRFRKTLWGPARGVILAFMANLLVTALTSLFHSGFKTSVLENPSKQLILMGVIGFIVWAKPNIKVFWYGLCAGTVSAVLIAFYQRFILDFDRARGFLHPIVFGDLALVMALMSLAGIGVLRPTRERIVSYISFAAGTSASLLSGSRGGWIILGIIFFPFSLYQKRATQTKVMMISLGGFLLCIVGLYFIPSLGVSERILDIAHDIQQYQRGDPHTSVGIRFELWKAAWAMFSEHPLAGVGRGQFPLRLQTLIQQGQISPWTQSLSHVHNEMLQALATHGLFGGVTLLFLYVAPFLFFANQLKSSSLCEPYARAGLVFVCSFVVFGLTEVLFIHHTGSVFYALVIGILSGICILQKDQRQG